MINETRKVKITAKQISDLQKGSLSEFALQMINIGVTFKGVEKVRIEEVLYGQPRIGDMTLVLDVEEDTRL